MRTGRRVSGDRLAASVAVDQLKSLREVRSLARASLLWRPDVRRTQWYPMASGIRMGLLAVATIGHSLAEFAGVSIGRPSRGRLPGRCLPARANRAIGWPLDAGTGKPPDKRHEPHAARARDLLVWRAWIERFRGSTDGFPVSGISSSLTSPHASSGGAVYVARRSRCHRQSWSGPSGRGSIAAPVDERTKLHQRGLDGP
jgi:hypothetical protein